jgi:hypothetical protein
MPLDPSFVAFGVVALVAVAVSGGSLAAWLMIDATREARDQDGP